MVRNLNTKNKMEVQILNHFGGYDMNRGIPYTITTNIPRIKATCIIFSKVVRDTIYILHAVLANFALLHINVIREWTFELT